MQAYLDIVRRTIKEGRWKENRTGIRTLAIPNAHFSCDMGEVRRGWYTDFPLLTTKKMAVKTMATELEGFIGGITDKKWYQDRKCHIWDAWSNPMTCPNWFSDQQRKKHQQQDADLGYIYGHQWRGFGKQTRPTPRILTDDEPTVYGVACYGKPTKPIVEGRLKATWYAMIRRCYVEKDKDFEKYGGRGVYVANRWLTFANFVDDVSQLEGWREKLDDWDSYILDTDMSQQQCYGPNTTRWTTWKEQAAHRSNSNQLFYGLSPTNQTYCGTSIKKFAKQHNLDPTGISHCISGKQDSHNGWQFWRDILIDESIIHYDQLNAIVERLKSNPNDRRMVCSAWNPNQLHQQALPPCHLVWILTHIDGVLNLHWTQRSCDLMLGVPFNIASYGLLLCLLAAHSGFAPGNLSGMLCDCHIYENQIPGVEEQVSRQPRKLPSIEINNFNKYESFNIFDWQATQIDLHNYDPYQKIDFGKVAV